MPCERATAQASHRATSPRRRPTVASSASTKTSAIRSSKRRARSRRHQLDVVAASAACSFRPVNDARELAVAPDDVARPEVAVGQHLGRGDELRPARQNLRRQRTGQLGLSAWVIRHPRQPDQPPAWCRVDQRQASSELRGPPLGIARRDIRLPVKPADQGCWKVRPAAVQIACEQQRRQPPEPVKRAQHTLLTARRRVAHGELADDDAQRGTACVDPPGIRVLSALEAHDVRDHRRRAGEAPDLLKGSSRGLNLSCRHRSIEA